jgi:hypothetical protein
LRATSRFGISLKTGKRLPRMASVPGVRTLREWHAALGVIAVSVACAAWLSRRDPGLGERVGSIIADE